MPCFTRERSIYRPKRKTNERDALAPKAVRPRSMKYHGLFGMGIVSQHLVSDEKWTPDSLEEQFAGLTNLLRRRVIYKRHESQANLRRLLLESKRLKLMCSDGRIKLQKISTGDNAHNIRNSLINHRDMQRLYHKMPIHLVADAINQRTFVLRKERDRLGCRLSQLKFVYKTLLLDKGKLENHIKYENEFVLEEELMSRVLSKKIENSNVRFRAIRTINTTYRKMVQVLLQDEIFYEPILSSLEGDMEEQTKFIKHLLYLGLPAIAKFKEISKQFDNLEEKSRSNLQRKLTLLASLEKKPAVIIPNVAEQPRQSIDIEDVKRYVRETRSMTKLKFQLLNIEATIKDLKLSVLCSQAREIYPRIKSQLDNNILLHHEIEKDMLYRRNVESKMEYGSVYHDVLVNNLSEEEINRLERIRELKNMLAQDLQFEDDTMEHLKNRADVYVAMRMSLWNLIEILRHVDRNPQMVRSKYPNSYLKLPLLKFDMLNMYAVPPTLYEEDNVKLMHTLKRKVFKLLRAFQTSMNTSVRRCTEQYHNTFLRAMEKIQDHNEDQEQAGPPMDDLLIDKSLAAIPNRKQIKAAAAKLVELAAKRE